jgi:hypothetical protein
VMVLAWALGDSRRALPAVRAVPLAGRERSA